MQKTIFDFITFTPFYITPVTTYSRATFAGMCASYTSYIVYSDLWRGHDGSTTFLCANLFRFFDFHMTGQIYRLNNCRDFFQEVMDTMSLWRDSNEKRCDSDNPPELILLS